MALSPTPLSTGTAVTVALTDFNAAINLLNAAFPIKAENIDKSSLLAAHPIGCIYISVVNTSPATLFGGTWAAFGAGKVLVGIDSGDADFDTVEETGGTKTAAIQHVHATIGHALTINEMPEHDHSVDVKPYNNIGSGTSSRATQGADTTGKTGGGQAHDHGNTGNMSTASTPSIVQPYIVVYMWKRTA